jgi:hypothetical protein
VSLRARKPSTDQKLLGLQHLSDLLKLTQCLQLNSFGDPSRIPEYKQMELIVGVVKR